MSSVVPGPKQTTCGRLGKGRDAIMRPIYFVALTAFFSFSIENWKQITPRDSPPPVRVSNGQQPSPPVRSSFEVAPTLLDKLLRDIGAGQSVAVVSTDEGIIAVSLDGSR